MTDNTNSRKNDPLFHRIKADTPDAADAKYEQYILKFSLYAALCFALLGLVWGMVIKSQMIIFDAVYSFVSVVAASLSVYVAKSVSRDDDVKFPFGRSQMEPMIMVFKSLLILIICVYAFGRSISSIFSGGREINAISAMIYSFIGIAGCLYGWQHIRRTRKKFHNSGLIKAESMQWLMDTLLSAAIFIGFLITTIMQSSGKHELASYMDPLMTMMAAIFFSVTPALTLISGIKDILLMTPEGEMYRISKSVLEDIARDHGFQGIILRLSKRGRELFYEISFVSDNAGDSRSMGEMDGIRQEVEDALGSLFDNPKWLNISFMHDKKWG